MFRKLGIAALAVVAGLFILNSTHLGSYARTAWQKVRVSAKRQVPLEFQLETIRNESAQLIPDMRKNLSLIASETVAVGNLKEEIGLIQVSLEKQKGDLRAMKDEIKSGDQKVAFNGRLYSRERINDLVARKLSAAKRCQDELDAKKSLLEAKEKSLDAAREQLMSIKTQKDQLEAQIAQIEAELKTLRLAQTKSNFHLDDSRLSRIKASLAEVRNEMKVQQTEAELLGQWNDEMIIGEKKAKTAAQVSKEVDDFLGGSSEEGVVVSKMPKE